MRATKVAFTVCGIIMLAGGIALAAWAATTDSDMALGIGIVGATLVVVGVVFLLVARYIGGLDTSATLRDGTPGAARVLSTRDTDTMINNVNLVVELGLLVMVPGRAPYEARIRHLMQGRTRWGAIQPGTRLAVKVDPHDPATVVVDPEGGAAAAPVDTPLDATTTPRVGSPVSGGAVPWAGTVPGAAGTLDPGSAEVVPVSGADIVARGVATEGRLDQVTPTGMTAGQVAGGLAPHESDDPVVRTGHRAEDRRSALMARSWFRSGTSHLGSTDRPD